MLRRSSWRGTFRSTWRNRLNCCEQRTYDVCSTLAPVATRIPRPSRMYVKPTHNKTPQEVLGTTRYKVLRGYTVSKSLGIKGLSVATSVAAGHVETPQVDTPNLMEAV